MCAGLAALFLGACDDGTSPTDPALSVAQADSLSELVTADASELAEVSAFDLTTGLSLARARGPAEAPLPCTPTVEPSPPENSDGDAVPDSVRIDFTGCTFTRGVVIHTLAGSIDLIDPTPTTTDFSARHVLTDFSRTLENTATDRTVAAVRNGTREIEGTTDTLGHTITSLSTAFTYANGATATHVVDWVARFQADVAGSISLGDPLPAGGWTLTGNSVWTRAALTRNVAVRTPAALHFEPACTLTPRFDAGSLELTVTRAAATSVVTVVFTACGQYTVTRS
jgi:hypothetical protein